MRRLLLASSLLLCSQSVFADAFSECPSRAFLTQDAIPKAYGINLVTGDYNLLQDDMGTNDRLNGIGFNTHDNFLYGWSYGLHKPVRIDSDFKIEPLDVENISGNDFYIADVSLATNSYYVYRPAPVGGVAGLLFGLFRISLDRESPDYLKMTRITNGRKLLLDVNDMAFHPTDGFAYTVDKGGVLHKIDVTNGVSTQLGNVGVTGIFGAIYFDVDENLYISSNNDGKIYRIAIGSGSSEAQLFSLGPSSSVNDGARCALASVIDVSNANVDFGDAPDSYGTLLEDNGARHGLLVDPDLYLGDLVDGESDGKPAPMSDDESDRSDDEDGVQFATALQVGENAVVIVDPSKAGILSAWVDSNQNGVFDTSEQIITDKSVTAGKQPIYIQIPDSARTGSTWARFRLSSTVGIGPTGGVSAGEVEDYQVNINSEGALITSYPSTSGWATIAFEDSWPFVDDYDMNDLVVNMRTTIYKKDGKVTLVNIAGELVATGTDNHNGFGIRLPGVLRDQVDEDNISFKINNRGISNNLPPQSRPSSSGLPTGVSARTADISPLEGGRSEAIFIVAYDTWNYVSAGENCNFYRTEEGCGSDIQMRFNLAIPMKAPIDADLSGVFDPFLFATPGESRGNHLSTPSGRRYEVHLKNQEPTEAFDYGLMNFSGQDASNPDDGHYFLTTNGMPWAMEIGSEWKYPKESRDLTEAYPQFRDYVQSEGARNSSWYTSANAVQSVLFKD